MNHYDIDDQKPLTKDAKYRLIPLGKCKATLTGTTKMTKEEVKDHLADFHVIAIGNILCKTPISRELIMFRKSQQKIGTADFNIPCKLTVSSHSDEIRRALTHFYSKLAQHGKYVNPN